MAHNEEGVALWYLNLSETQESAYDTFLKSLEQSNALVKGADDKWTLLRFLKARQYDPEKAKVMYLSMAKWRTENDIESLYQNFDYQELDAVLPFYTHFYHKVDKFGRPVYVELVGKHQCARLMEVTTEKRLTDYHVYTWERFHKQLMPACARLAGQPRVAATVILDLEGLGLLSFDTITRTLLAALAKIDQDYYPESLGVMFIINTPFIFKTIWTFVNPLLEERTRKKIIVLGADYQESLKEVIPEENLLEMFGGTSKVDNLKDSVGPWSECPEVIAKPWHPVKPGQEQSAAVPA